MSLHQEPNKPNRWLHRLYILLALLILTPPAKLLWDVYRIPDYRGGNAYISTSPDGMYKGIDMIVAETTPYSGWSPFLMGVSGYNSRVIMGLADGKTGRMLAYVPINNNDLSSGRGGIWACENMKSPCVRYQSSFRDSSLRLPPNRWHSLVAWAAFELRGLGEPEFDKVEHRRSTVGSPEEFEGR